MMRPETGKEKELLERIRDSLAELDLEATKYACLKAIDSKIEPYRCVLEGLSPGLQIVGDKYQRGEYFLMNLIMAGEIMEEALTTIENYLKTSITGTNQAIVDQPIGKVVIGAVKGDLHDIGKNLVITLLKANNFDVYDLGSDVQADEFVEAVRMKKPDILGLSALLTTTLDEMKTVVEKLEETGLRGSVKVIIGGGAIHESFAKEIGADGWTTNAVTGIQLCKRWIKKDD